jgi:hypothetical protein
MKLQYIPEATYNGHQYRLLVEITKAIKEQDWFYNPVTDSIHRSDKRTSIPPPTSEHILRPYRNRVRNKTLNNGTE